MISIQIFRDDNTEIAGFRVTGHADAAPHGQDIVCAGVSALTQSALLGLEQCAKRQFQLVMKSGKLIMNLTGNPDNLTQAILETMVLGLKEIACNYPQYVRIVENRR